MKNSFFLLFTVLISFTLLSQEKTQKPYSIGVDYFYGNIYEHNFDIGHLITGHPEGVMLSYNRKTYGLTEAEQRYGFPDWGFTFLYQNMKNPVLGDNYSLYGHYTWYFLKRNLQLTVGTGIGYNTNPYDINTNFKNNAYGTSLMSTSLLKFGFVRENIWNGIGLNAGLSFIHYSNGNFKAPNTSTNTYSANIGLSYLLDHENFPDYIPLAEDNENTYNEPISYNFVLRGGINQSDLIGQDQRSFFVVSAFANKRISFKSSLQAGVDFFFSNFIKEYVKYRSVAFPEDGLTGDEDYKRVGVFLGHELRFNKTAFLSQVGYYVYWPNEFENRVYNRMGLKRYFFDNNYFATVSVKSHWAKAEAIEFAVGIRI
ncbi:MAG: hypothetical protein ACI9SJ_001173 [Flavobacteriaceae bacterium]|jgi:hypothetical protein|uniref:acyloxyacyl hydrolase n=1 Tax=Candidatus Marifrigoribacter sp. Uisw_064 TaxID=3230970 RepID=UPI003ADB2ECD